MTPCDTRIGSMHFYVFVVDPGCVGLTATSPWMMLRMVKPQKSPITILCGFTSTWLNQQKWNKYDSIIYIYISHISLIHHIISLQNDRPSCGWPGYRRGKEEEHLHQTLQRTEKKLATHLATEDRLQELFWELLLGKPLCHEPTMTGDGL